MGIYYTEGIILKHQDFREADRLLTVFTKNYGKIQGLAKGSRKISSKLAGNLEPFIEANLMVVRGRNMETVAGAEVIKNFSSLKKNYEAVSLANYFSEVIDRSMKPHQRELHVYSLLLEVLGYLDSNMISTDKLPQIKWFFIWHYLSHLGYHPELFKCQSCGQPLANNHNFFSLRKGGIIDGQCHQGSDAGSLPASENVIKVLRHLLGGEIKTITRLKISRELGINLEGITNAFLNFTQEQRLNMPGVPL